MFIASLFLVLAAPGSPLSATDAAFLTRIDRAVSRMSDRKTAFVRFEKTVTKADAIRCNQVLPRLKPNSVSYADCAFVQAWHGLDYAANIQRLLRPFRVARASEKQWEKEYPNDMDGANLNDTGGVYQAFNWLYLKHHDLNSLGAWEDLTLIGAPGEPCYDNLSELWDNHAEDMLRAAYGHPLRINHLAETLVWGNQAADIKNHNREEAAEARRFTRSKDKRVASAAQAVVSRLRNGNWKGW